jgi:hypothetical protein
MSNREQVSVLLPAELREYVQRGAEREVTSQAAVISRLVTDAARQDSREGLQARPTMVHPAERVVTNGPDFDPAQIRS